MNEKVWKMLVLKIFFSDQNEKENTEVKEKSIDKFL